MVSIPDNAKPMTDEEFDAWWAAQSEEKKKQWLEYSAKHLVKN